MIVATATAPGLSCSDDSQCRRNVCILSACAPRALTDGVCSLNTHCFFAATESCIKGKCLTKSPTGGDCDDTGDCSTAGDACFGGKCGAPINPSLMVWDGNKAPLNNGQRTPSVSVNGLLFVFEGYTSNPTPVTVESYDPDTKTWTSKTGPGLKSYGFSVVAVGSNIFLIGGFTNENFQLLTTFYSYNPASDQWDTNWNQLPEGRQAFAAAVVDSTVFIFGGADSSGRTDTIRSLDVSNKLNNWDTLDGVTLPVGASEVCAVAVNKDIYLTGGRTDAGDYLDQFLKFNTLDPTSPPSSSGLQAMLTARSNHMSFYDATNKRLYAVSGFSDFEADVNTVEYLDLNNPTGSWASVNAPSYTSIDSSFSGGLIGSLFHFVSLQTLQILDVSVPSSVKWSPFPNSPTPGASVVHMTGPNKITAVGTGSRNTAFYDTITNTWTTGGDSSNFPVPTLDPASAVVNGEVYVIAGSDGITSTAVVYALNSAGSTWTKKDNLPQPLVGGCAAAYGTDIYFFGGSLEISSNPVSTLYKMDTTKPSGSQWTTISPVSGSATAVSFCSAVVADQKLLIIGGGTATSGASPIGTIQSFNIPTQSWDSPLIDVITPRSRLSAVFLKGFVFIIGGTGDSSFTPLSKAEVFNVNTKAVTTITEMPTPRYSLGAVTDGTSVFAVGGSGSTSLEKLHTPSP